MSKPLALTDAQMSAVMSAAAPLAPADRDPFLRALAEALRQERVIGDGTINAAVRSLQRRYFRPPAVRHDPPTHHHRKIGEPLL